MIKQMIVVTRLGFTLLLITISQFLYAQSKANLYLGVYMSGDPKMIYPGPSFQVGLDYPVNGNWLINGYGHYFSNKHYDRSYRNLTAGTMIQYSIGKKNRWYAALGVAFQDTYEDNPYHEDATDRTIIVPSYRIGLITRVKSYFVCPEIFATGPHIYHGGKSIAILTLPCFGVRVFPISKDDKRRIRLPSTG